MSLEVSFKTILLCFTQSSIMRSSESAKDPNAKGTKVVQPFRLPIGNENRTIFYCYTVPVSTNVGLNFCFLYSKALCPPE